MLHSKVAPLPAEHRIRRKATKSEASVPVAIRDVVKTFGSYTALDAVSLDVRSGEFLTLLGPSGSGKTTLLMTIAGFARPNAGSIKFGEEEVVTVPPHKRGVGMVFQNYALFPHMNVMANVAFALKLQRRPKDEIAERVQWALDLVRLADYGQRDVSQLSGGQRQRVAIARAIVFEPRVLLMDEPLSALDKKLREQMQVELRQLHDTLGTTTIYVTHDQKEALTMSDRIAVMDHARICQIGTPQEIYNQPDTRFVADFVGESTFLPVTVRGGEIYYADIRIETPTPARSGKEATAMIRPENVRIVGADRLERVNVFEGTIADIVYQGDTMTVRLALKGGKDEMLMRRGSETLLSDLAGRAVGDSLTVAVPVRNTVLIQE